MSRYQVKSTEGRELERQEKVLRRGGHGKEADIRSQHAVQADIDKNRGVAHADSKARNGGR